MSRRCTPRETGDGSQSTGGLGPVSRDELYPLPVLATKLGWKAHAIRQARRRGLPVLAFGSRRYVFGADAIDFFRRHHEAAEAFDALEDMGVFVKFRRKTTRKEGQ